jgi:prepilin-type N-terminal cleavage/methylation domain-containing protein
VRNTNMKNFKKKVMNNNGFTLVEILISVGLMGLVSLASFSIINSSQKSVKHMDNKMVRALFVSSFGQYLFSQNGCSEFIGQTPTIVYDDVDFINDYNGYGGSLLSNVEANHVIKRNHVEVESFRYRLKEEANVVEKNIDGNVTRKQLLQVLLQVRTSRKGQVLAALPADNIIKDQYYEIPILTDGADNIISCDINMTQGQICQTLSLLYDADTETCGPNPGASSCIVKGSFATISCSPGGYSCDTSFGGDGKNYFTGGHSCSAGETTHRTGYRESSYKVGCGKKCTRTITRREVFYTCMICPP